jgi:hypothetical protein
MPIACASNARYRGGHRLQAGDPFAQQRVLPA